MEVLDPRAVAVEDPWHDPVRRALDGLGVRTLAIEHLAELGREREHPALPVLRLAWFEPQPARVEVDVVPLARENLRPDTPARDVGDLEDGLQVVGQPAHDGLELVVLEEARADVVLDEHRDVRAAVDLAGLLGEAEHALERGQLAVDRGVRRVLADVLVPGITERNHLFRGMNQMSGADLKSWSPPEIQIIVGVIKNGGLGQNGEPLAWKHLKGGRLQGGSLQGAMGKYAIRMTSWFSPDGKQKKRHIAYIRCPFATGMDR